ncbi:MAG: putative membrane protein [candidate division WWE3 bacterium GW2011_GWF1_42_14]|uniref:Diadenylate cyclase n=2 Tax=Katanobacteria TaxID=422282 RepID=A0A0G0YRJ3_UNCKA|nr:MAG: putative membrane protein [candidate division WWE3 bacterium GW2011_GWA1_42_12]KKS34854.1 MAG: putative membrane protein [candidate division WWE3 bacterium GW2011_GWD1_42_14]KKS39209.1 MAG: putative membrane protein [candidate division WWE3 bacterium GW2011_GWF1_42_14]KKS40707.1 MAG: putative membrane protein [candidate division WWE3 bacterium GW2011_GWE1_42_16]KKS66862.1 MAG: putative membrane protein [candidate division WWE3 bacterium GW2011_GWB1_42_6]
MFSVLNNLVKLKGNLYITDFFDILIVALLIYSLFLFLRNTKTLMVFLGLAIAATLYLFAKSFNLYVTLLALKYFIGVSVLIFVIIFQNEIRRYFEFLGLIGSRQLKVLPLATRSPTTSEIIQACVKMAQAKIGVLIVVQGKDSLDQFVDGGVPLDGVISEELISSIFEPRSYGHDGALIISNNRVSKFATHLPLSTNFKEIGKHGTRHSAALGITELTDAFAIVVSEENGKISISKDGKLKTLQEFTDLEKEFEKYIKAKFSKNVKESKLKKIIKEDFLLRLGSLTVAGIIWFFAAYQAGIVEKTYNVPFDNLKVPKNIIIQEYSPKELKIKVSTRGEDSFKDIAVKDFKINLDLSNLQSGINKLQISKNLITGPANFSIISFEPSTLLLTAQKYYPAEIPISVKTAGKLKADLALKGAEAEPKSLKVWVPEGIEASTEISTEPIDLSDKNESTVLPVKLLLPEGILLEDKMVSVSVALTIEEDK